MFVKKAITFERINIFTCGKKHGNRDESGNKKGVRALARAQIVTCDTNVSNYYPGKLA